MKPQSLFSTFFIVAATAIAVAAAQELDGDPQVVIFNRCPHNIFVKLDYHNYDAPVTVLSPGRNLVLPLNHNPGNAYKFSTNPRVTNPIQFDYTITDRRVYYDISDRAGHPFDLRAYDVGPSGQTECPPVGCGRRIELCRSVQACPDDHAFFVLACD